MKVQKKALTADVEARWAHRAQLLALDALMAESSWGADCVAFQGGTSLHLSWHSPRFSEDLDFLIGRQVSDIDRVMPRVARRIGECLMAEDPGFSVELQDKTRDAERMPVYHLSVGHPAYLGKAKVKIEFWRVDAAYLAAYPTEFRTPAPHGDWVSRVSHPVPAATLETAFCDKLTAFATRPYLKWRDVHDLWWIGTQTDASLDRAAVLQQFRHNLSAYQLPDGLSPADALRRFLDRARDDVVRQADPDLKRWLPSSVWARLHPHGVEEMVDYTRRVLAEVASDLDCKTPAESRSLPKRVKP